MRIMLMVHPYHRPDQNAARATTERDVWRTLRRAGHSVTVVSVLDDPRTFDRELRQVRPHVVFNLLEEFRGEGVFDFHPVSHLESLGIAYTGCNPRGLIFSRNKFATMAIADAVGVRTPRTRLDSRAAGYPAFVKFNREDASRGITRANVVRSDAAATRERRRLRAKFPGEVITQDFIVGREVSVPTWGNARATTLPPWVLHLPPDRVATEKLKFDASYRRRIGVRAGRYPDSEVAARLQRDSVRLYRALDLSGYARFDFRVQGRNHYLIDVNANPNLSVGEDFANAARAAGREYDQVLEHIMSLARRYEPRR